MPINENAVGLPFERGPIKEVSKQIQEWDHLANPAHLRPPKMPTTPFASGMPDRKPASPES